MPWFIPAYKDPDDWYNDTLTNCVGGANGTSLPENDVSRFIYFQIVCYGVKPLEQPISLTPKFPTIHPMLLQDRIRRLHRDIGIGPRDLQVGQRLVPGASGPLPIFYQRLSDGKMLRDHNDEISLRGRPVRAVLRSTEPVPGPIISSGKDVDQVHDAVVEAMGLTEYPEPEIRELEPDDAPSILLDPS